MSGESRRQRLKWLIGLVAGLVAVGLTYAWTANRALTLGYEISNLQAERKEALDLYSKLRVELASLRRPELVEATAVGKLGLVRPPVDRVVVLK
jgi:cell division protein FtsL